MHHGNAVTMDDGGVTIADHHGNAVGARRERREDRQRGAAEPLALGSSLAAAVATFLTALNAHVHLGSPPTGAATAMPDGNLPGSRSAKHTVQ